jgi:hypothetical protein
MRPGVRRRILKPAFKPEISINHRRHNQLWEAMMVAIANLKGEPTKRSELGVETVAQAYDLTNSAYTKALNNWWKRYETGKGFSNERR